MIKDLSVRFGWGALAGVAWLAILMAVGFVLKVMWLAFQFGWELV